MEETNKDIQKETKKEKPSEGAVTKTKKSNKKKPGICTTNCQYDSVRRCAKALGFKVSIVIFIGLAALESCGPPLCGVEAVQWRKRAVNLCVMMYLFQF